jgi:hypothetical protein
MARFAIVAALILASVAAAPTSARADSARVDPAQLAEAYFDETERFDALLTYETIRGPIKVVFTLSRRWRDGEAELLFDVREPERYDDWALLVRQNRGASDDLFAYLGSSTGRRVRRLAATHLEREAFYSMLALADFRPTALGELTYLAGPERIVADTPCHTVIGVPKHKALGFSRVELAFATDTGLLLESRYFRGEQEFRRLSAGPKDYTEFDGRRLATRRIAHSYADSGQVELVLRNVLPTSDLPDELFSHRNLLVQRFPDL